MSNHKPFLLIISAPSGCGKTTLLRMLKDSFYGLGFSVSHTTRPKRSGEKNGVDYYFVDQVKFSQMLKSGEFVESACVHSNSYGTSFSSIDSLLAKGDDVVLDIDVQGMQLLKSEGRYDLVSIFIMPPSIEELENRLHRRNTDTDEVVNQRLMNAKDEIASAHLYDYQVVNDSLDDAFISLSAIVTAERLRTFRIK